MCGPEGLESRCERPSRHLSSVFRSFASRAPARVTRRRASDLADDLYAVVRAEGPVPAPIGETYTSLFASSKLSCTQSAASILLTTLVAGAGRAVATCAAEFGLSLELGPRRSSEKPWSSSLQGGAQRSNEIDSLIAFGMSGVHPAANSQRSHLEYARISIIGTVADAWRRAINSKRNAVAGFCCGLSA